MFGSFQTAQRPTIPKPLRPLYRVASIFENVVKSESRVGMLFGVLLPFAHFGVPVMSIITRSPWRPDWKTSSSRSPSLYAGSLPSDASAGLVGAIVAQLAVVWMTEAPVAAASARFCSRAGENRNELSSKNPIGIRVAACAAAAGTASPTTSATSAKRAVFCTGILLLSISGRTRGRYRAPLIGM